MCIWLFSFDETDISDSIQASIVFMASMFAVMNSITAQ